MNVLSNPTKQNFYNLISEYFNNPLLKKIKDVSNRSYYGIKYNSLLLNENKYLIVVTNLCESKEKNLKDINWSQLQLRSLPLKNEFSDLPSIPQNFNRDKHLKIPLQIVNRTEKLSSYTIQDFPVELHLIHTKNILYEYPNQGNLITALETAQTLLIVR